MREEYLDYVGEYMDKLEPLMDRLESSGFWRKLERSSVAGYAWNKTGLVLVYQVCVTGGPAHAYFI